MDERRCVFLYVWKETAEDDSEDEFSNLGIEEASNEAEESENEIAFDEIQETEAEEIPEEEEPCIPDSDIPLDNISETSGFEGGFKVNITEDDN